MRKYLFLAFITIYSSCCYAQSRITGGFDLDIEQVPWQVLLEANGNYVCGGSIIAPNYVLTAKHCVAGLNPNGLIVNMGMTCKNEIAQANRRMLVELYFTPH